MAEPATAQFPKADMQAAQVIQGLEQVGREASSSAAMTHAAAWTRWYWDLLDWFRHAGMDPAHDEVVQKWRDESVLLARPKSRHERKELEKRLSGAKHWLEDQDEQLAAVYASVTSRPEYAALPRSARHVYDALHAVARTEGRLGGPSVAQSHRMLLAVMEARGHTYKSVATVTKARVELARHGFIDAEPGQPWAESGGRTISTVYHLLPPHLGLSDHSSAISELALSARIGLVHSPGKGKGVEKGVKDARPAPLSPVELGMLAELRAERRTEKSREKWKAEAARDGREQEAGRAAKARQDWLDAAEAEAALEAAAAADPELAVAAGRRLAADVGRLLAWAEPGEGMAASGPERGGDCGRDDALEPVGSWCAPEAARRRGESRDRFLRSVSDGRWLGMLSEPGPGTGTGRDIWLDRRTGHGHEQRGTA